MRELNYEAAISFEHRFWLQILGDHARFIFSALSPAEKADIQKAQGFIKVFDNLLAEARSALDAAGMERLTQHAFQAAKELRAFKLSLLKRHLVGVIMVNLPPTFFNHMLNELEEYLHVTSYLLKQQAPPHQNPIHYHLLWVIDAAGHAATVDCALDPVEKVLKAKSRAYEKQFEESYIKAEEICKYMRTKITQFPALNRYNKQTGMLTLEFQEFLKTLAELKISKQLLGTLNPLMADHMAREECYYLTKLAQVSEFKAPNCDPTKPRIEVPMP